jgi:mannose-6-phosphate isomerase-like protein (cupin superfamily)
MGQELARTDPTRSARFRWRDLRAERAASGEMYREFLRVAATSAGVYEIPAGGTDPQTPHREDEVYYVVRGRGRFQSSVGDGEVETGDLLFVPARMPHRFHDVTEDLELLVLFAQAESPDPP